LVITPQFESVIQVDNLEAAQFIYLLLNNKRIRHVIDTITSKVVLILGRLTPERKAVLDAIREELRRRDSLPILFDFHKPDSKDLTGTISTLANMARFIIADLTDSASVPHELAMIIPAPSCRFKQSCWKDSSSMRCSPILGADTIGCLSLIDTNPSISCSLS
jgi:hypothetical protein